MSVKVMAWVWEHSRSKPVQRLVLLAIADCANDAGSEAYPSTQKLAEKTGLSERGVRKTVSELVALGELKVQYKEGPRGCNRYRVVMSDQAPRAGYPEQDATRHNVPREHGAGSTRNSMPGTRHESAADPAPCAPEPSENHQTTSLEPSNTPPPAPPKPRRTPAADDPEFAKFWTAYPRKVDKGHARNAWATAIKNGTEANTIIAAAEQFAAQCARNRTEQKYIPYPTTWLRGERWADQPATPSSNGHQPYRDPADPSVYFGDL